MFSLKNILTREERKKKPQKKPVRRNFRIPLIGEKAPSFTTETTAGTINFPFDFGASWKIILSHPMDFTPVCSTELIEIANLQDEFENIGVKLLIVSIDPLETHKQWKTSL